MPEPARGGGDWEKVMPTSERALARIDVVVRAFHPDTLPYLERLEAGGAR